MLIVNARPMCLEDEESIDDLLLIIAKYRSLVGSWYWGGSNVVDLFPILYDPCLSIGGWEWGLKEVRQFGSFPSWKLFGLLGKK